MEIRERIFYFLYFIFEFWKSIKFLLGLWFWLLNSIKEILSLGVIIILNFDFIILKDPQFVLPMGEETGSLVAALGIRVEVAAQLSLVPWRFEIYAFFFFFIFKFLLPPKLIVLHSRIIVFVRAPIVCPKFFTIESWSFNDSD